MFTRHHVLYNAAAISALAGPPPEAMTYEEMVLSLSPVGYWPMSEASGDLADATGNGWTASDNGNPLYQQAGPTIYGVAKHAVAFDGSGDYFAVSSNIDNAVTTQMTVSFWVRVDPTASGQHLVCMTTAGALSWRVTMDSAGTITFYCWQEDGATLHGNATAGGAWDDGDWHHVVAWIDPDGHINISIDDGDTTAEDTTLAGTWNGATTSGLSFGALNVSGGTPMTGWLSQIAYWHSDIGAAARKTLAGGDAIEEPPPDPDPPPPDPPTYQELVLATSPRAYWPMQEASGNCLDATGNGFTATVNGNPLRQQPGPTIYGTAHNAVAFDGTGDFATVASGVDDNVTTQMMVSLWFMVAPSATGHHLVAMNNTGVRSWRVTMASDGSVSFWAFQTDGATEHGLATAGSGLDDGNWHHLSAWIAADGHVNLSIDDGAATGEDTSLSGTWNGETSSGLAFAAFNDSGSSAATCSLAHVAYFDTDPGATVRQTLAGGD